jgi:plasmid stability protein
MKKIQYTIRGIPDRLDELLRRSAMKEGKSLNEETLEALKKGIGYEARAVNHLDLDDLAGTWVEDPEFDRVILEMDKVDEDLWA